MNFLVNIDVPDLAAGEAFYAQAFGLAVSRRFDGGAEMTGGPAPLWLLEKKPGTLPAPGASLRDYARHWSPLHLDIVVDDVEAAIRRAVEAGAVLEKDKRSEVWGDIALLADPFGNGFCLIAFRGRGYDEIAASG